MFDTPEDIVVRYFNWSASIGAPALDPVAVHGRVYAIECKACHHQIRHSKCKGLTIRTEVCGRCGRPWDFEDQFILRGNLQITRRPGSTEHWLSPWVDIGPELQRLYDHREHRWPVRTFCARCIGQLSLREVATEASERFRRAPFAWTKERVATLYDQGRAVVGDRFARKKWLGAEWRLAS